MSEVIDIGNKVSLTKEQRKLRFQKLAEAIENEMMKMPGVKIGHEMDAELCPLTHTFCDGLYVREIFMPAGLRITSKIHKVKHPYFVMVGKCSVLTEDGIQEIEAPYQGITEAGTKRIIIVHEDTIWITVHSTKETDLEKIEEEIIAKDFSDPALPQNQTEKIEVSKEA